MKEIYLSLGSNLGDKNNNFIEAINRLNINLGSVVIRESRRIITEPWGFESENEFLNSVVVYQLDDSFLPETLLRVCKKIEAEMGRSECVEYDKNGRRIYFSRIIDIDILLFDNQIVSANNLIIPHPLISERDFVLIPLKEVSSEYIRNIFPTLFV